MTIEQIIEWHRVRHLLAVKGARLAFENDDAVSVALFTNEADFHMETVRLLTVLKARS